MDIRTAKTEDGGKVRAFYHALIDAMHKARYKPGWKKDVYPSPEMLAGALARGELFIGESESRLISAMIINHEINASCKNFAWPTPARADEVSVIHAFGVHPDFARQGHAKEMLRLAIKRAGEARHKALRVDVLEGNIPAERLYLAMGFHYLHCLPMFYEDTGWARFKLYEYAL